MRLVARVTSWLRASGRRADFEREMQDEMRIHLGLYPARDWRESRQADPPAADRRGTRRAARIESAWPRGPARPVVGPLLERADVVLRKPDRPHGEGPGAARASAVIVGARPQAR